MRRLSFLFVLLISYTLAFEDEYCSLDSQESCAEANEPNKYSTALDERYKKYYEAIKKAEKDYIPCNNTNCGCYTGGILRDLKPFKKNGISRELINAAKPRGTFYQIIDRKLYRQKDCMFPSRCAGVEHFILRVIDNLPNMDLIINARDYPQSSKHFGGPLPIFSFSKTDEYYDIIYPAWAFWEGGPAISLYPRGLGRWDEHRKSLNKATKQVPWEKKENKAFFRGSRTSSERDSLVLLSRRKPDLVDAKYTKNQAWKSEEDTLHMPPASEVSLESHCTYKYLFNYRGVAASFRHKHLFLCNSLVFHVGDEWTEFYYNAMIAWIHYIPVPSDADQNELAHLIMFAKEKNEISRKIADSGRNFVWDNLKLSDVMCYWKKLLRRYSKLLTYKPSLDKQLIQIDKRK